MSAWIEMIEDSKASGAVKEAYDRVRTPHGTVDNVMRAHSLRPHTMHGHVALYRSVLHHPGNTLPTWFLEVVASYTSILNNCDYSLTHHFDNACRLIGDNKRAAEIRRALDARRPEAAFDGAYLALLRYAERLTLKVGALEKSDVTGPQETGCDDGQILEVNQVCAYFNYSNRLLNGLGVTTKGDVVGYYSDADHKASS